MEVSQLSAQAPIFTPSGVGLPDGSGGGGRGRHGDGHAHPNVHRFGRGLPQRADAGDGAGSSSATGQNVHAHDRPEQRGRQRRHPNETAPHDLNITDSTGSSSAGLHAAASLPAHPRARGGGAGRGRGRRDPQHVHGRGANRGSWQPDADGAPGASDLAAATSRRPDSGPGLDDAPPGLAHAAPHNDRAAAAGPSNRGSSRRQPNQHGQGAEMYGGNDRRRHPPRHAFEASGPEPNEAGTCGDAGTSGGAGEQGFGFSAGTPGEGGRGRGGGGRRGGLRGRGRAGVHGGPSGGQEHGDVAPSEGAHEHQHVDFGRQRGRRGGGFLAGGGRGGRGRGFPGPRVGAGACVGYDGSADAGGASDAAAAAAAAVAAAAASGGGGAASGDSDSDDGETLTCVICCEEVAAVAVGGCGHSHTCAKCCLRLRLCYRDLRCPLCKAVNKEVVVARPPLPAGASFDSLAGSQQQREALWQQPKWAKGVLVYDPPPPPQQQQQQQQQQHGGGGDGGIRAHHTHTHTHTHNRRQLHKSLMAMTSRSCSVCDRHGRRPFGTMNLLLEHIRSAHDRALCDVCLGAGLRFPLEYPAFDAAGLAAHMASDHPRCEYCNLAFYGKDELYAHMTQRHFTCHVCSRLGRHHLYFQDADTLLVHLSEEHHACDHPDCFGCMIAYATRDELNSHIRDRHSSYMPRWDQSRARPLLLDFITPRGPAAAAALAAAAAAAPAGGGASGRGGRGNDRRGRGAAADRPPPDAAADAGHHSAPHQRPRPGQGRSSRLEDPEAFPSLQSQAPNPQQQQPLRQAELGDMHETEGGLAVIDDDLGMGVGVGTGMGRPAAGARLGGGGAAMAAGRDGGGGGDGTGPGPGSGPGGARLAGVWAGRTPGSGTFREDFPELSAAAGAAPRGAWGLQSGGARRGQGQAGDGSGLGPGSPPRGPTAAALLSQSQSQSLRKVTLRCPCGNRVEHLALRPEEKPHQLTCDRACAAKQRRAQLADAFGVEAADSHVPYFDRHRTPNYPPELILAAQSAGPEWVASLERDLARFIADPSARRTSLAAGMSQAQRRLVHELAGHYGLTSHSIGQGAARAVQLLKGASSGVPTRLLSVVAVATSPEELARLTAGGAGGAGGSGGWVLKLVDVAPGANVHHYLRAWEGDYTAAPVPGSTTSLALTFTREAAFRDCCSRLGGGVRGVFLTTLDRAPATSAAAGAGAPAGAAGVGARPPPPAPLAAPPGWQVLRGNPSASGPRKAAGPVAGAAAAGSAVAGPRPAADPAASVRAALAADAWASDDDNEKRPQAQRGRGQDREGGFEVAGGRWTDGGVGAACRPALEPQLPGRGPPLDLAKETLWSALLSEEGEEEGDGGDEGQEGTGVRRDEEGEGGTAGSPARPGEGESEGGGVESWEDAGLDG